MSTVLPQSALETASPRHSYAQILKSSAVIGGSSLMNIALGMVRTKAMALLLGPSGVGLFGIFGSIANLTQSVAGLGINSSGVRQIAEAAGTGDAERIAQTAMVLRRVALLLGFLGAALLLIFGRQISTFTFGSGERAGAVAFLSLAVFFNLVSDGQGALIQGLRRISDLARMRVLGALFGTLVSIPVVYVLGERGVVPSLVFVGVTAFAASTWYSRKIDIPPCSLSLARMGDETAALLKLGFAFMASGLMAMGVAYFVRITVLHKVGFAGAGLYQSAWMLGGLYVGFILQAMGADFYPRLTASADDHPACNRMVNEQAHIGLLLAAPGVIGTLTFAPLVITIFYSARFGPALDLLRWISLGVTLQVIGWPMGYIILAKGKQGLLFWSQLAWAAVSMALAWGCVTRYGLNGAGIAFFASYVFYTVMIYAIVRRLSGFRWSAENRSSAAVLLSLIALVFSWFYLLPPIWRVSLGASAVMVSGGYSVRVLGGLFPPEQLPRPVRRLILLLRMGRSNS